MYPRHIKLINDSLKLISEAKGKLEDVSLDLHDKFDNGSDRWQDQPRADGRGWGIQSFDDIIYNTLEDVEEQLRDFLKRGFRN